jgi:hypothetical protein
MLAAVRLLAPHSAMCPLTPGLKQDLESAFGGPHRLHSHSGLK